MRALLSGNVTIRMSRRFLAGAAALMILLTLGIRVVWHLTHSRDGLALVTEFPAVLPPGGVFMDGSGLRIELRPLTTRPRITEAEALRVAAQNTNTRFFLPAVTALYASFTDLATLPPPDSPVPFRTLKDVPSWIVTFTARHPISDCLGPPTASCPPTYFQTDVINANTGQLEEGFEEK